MRKIKFRGKRKDNNEWVYGYYFTFLDISTKKIHYIKSGGQDTRSGFRDYEVDSETVGQYTGVKDKNGKDIYEGDVCEKYTQDFKTWSESAEPVGEVFFQDGSFLIGRDFEIFLFTVSVKKIGNIIDNPELIKKNNI